MITVGCPWEQCEHSFNAHGRDHCHACGCEKPPPPPPAAPSPPPGAGLEDSFGELETIEAERCSHCSAYVADREKHVGTHEQTTNTLANLVMSVSGLDRRIDQFMEHVDALERRLNRLIDQINNTEG